MGYRTEFKKNWLSRYCKVDLYILVNYNYHFKKYSEEKNEITVQNGVKLKKSGIWYQGEGMTEDFENHLFD